MASFRHTFPLLPAGAVLMRDESSKRTRKTQMVFDLCAGSGTFSASGFRPLAFNEAARLRGLGDGDCSSAGSSGSRLHSSRWGSYNRTAPSGNRAGGLARVSVSLHTSLQRRPPVPKRRGDRRKDRLPSPISWRQLS